MFFKIFKKKIEFVYMSSILLQKLTKSIAKNRRNRNINAVFQEFIEMITII